MLSYWEASSVVLRRIVAVGASVAVGDVVAVTILRGVVSGVLSYLIVEELFIGVHVIWHKFFHVFLHHEDGYAHDRDHKNKLMVGHHDTASSVINRDLTEQGSKTRVNPLPTE